MSAHDIGTYDLLVGRWVEIMGLGLGAAQRRVVSGQMPIPLCRRTFEWPNGICESRKAIRVAARQQTLALA